MIFHIILAERSVPVPLVFVSDGFGVSLPDLRGQFRTSSKSHGATLVGRIRRVFRKHADLPYCPFVVLYDDFPDVVKLLCYPQYADYPVEVSCFLDEPEDGHPFNVPFNSPPEVEVDEPYWVTRYRSMTDEEISEMRNRMYHYYESSEQHSKTLTERLHEALDGAPRETWNWAENRPDTPEERESRWTVQNPSASERRRLKKKP